MLLQTTSTIAPKQSAQAEGFVSACPVMFIEQAIDNKDIQPSGGCLGT